MTVVDGGGLKSTLLEMLSADFVRVRNVVFCICSSVSFPFFHFSELAATKRDKYPPPLYFNVHNTLCISFVTLTESSQPPSGMASISNSMCQYSIDLAGVMGTKNKFRSSVTISVRALGCCVYFE